VSFNESRKLLERTMYIFDLYGDKKIYPKNLIYFIYLVLSSALKMLIWRNAELPFDSGTITSFCTKQEMLFNWAKYIINGHL